MATSPSTRAAGNPPNSYRTGPDEKGFFGLFGGRFVAETLMPLILDLEQAYNAARKDPNFDRELTYLNKHYSGRPSPLYFAERVTQELGGAKIYFKRDELNHTGSHKINNCLGQILLAKRMGKTRIIAETGAGQHGVAVATVCAKFDLPCEIYMGATDVERQAPNVARMKLLGAKVHAVTSGAGTLKDSMNEALRDWVTNVRDTYYIIGTAAGPHPYPQLVRDFQSVIGRETREQMMEAEGRLPDVLVACIGGGSNAIGLFHPFLDDKEVAIYGVEAAGHGLEVENGHAASMNGGSAGGAARQPHVPVLQDGRWPDSGRVTRSRLGWIIPAWGPSTPGCATSGGVEVCVARRTPKRSRRAADVHQAGGHHPGTGAGACAGLCDETGADLWRKTKCIIMNLCGRGDKDLHTVAKVAGAAILVPAFS